MSLWTDKVLEYLYPQWRLKLGPVDTLDPPLKEIRSTFVFNTLSLRPFLSLDDINAVPGIGCCRYGMEKNFKVNKHKYAIALYQKLFRISFSKHLQIQNDSLKHGNRLIREWRKLLGRVRGIILWMRPANEKWRYRVITDVGHYWGYYAGSPFSVKSFEDRAPVDFIYKYPISIWVALTSLKIAHQMKTKL